MPKKKSVRIKIEKHEHDPVPEKTLFLIDTARAGLQEPKILTTVKLFQKRYPLLNNRSFIYVPDGYGHFRLFVKLNLVNQEYFKLLYDKNY